MTKPICGIPLSDGRICGRELKLVSEDDGEQGWVCPIHPVEQVEEPRAAPLSFVEEVEIVE